MSANGRKYHGLHRQGRTWHEIKGLSQDSSNFQCCSKDEAIWDLYIHCLTCPHKALNATGIWFLEDIRKTDTKCCWWRVCRRLLAGPPGFWTVRHFWIESGLLPDSHNLIWSFPSVRMQCETGFQALSSGANPPVNIDSWFWRTAGKMTSQWALLPSLPVSSSEPSGARRRRNKKKKAPKTPKAETPYCCLN